jgi:hypothetical protein
MNYGPAIASVFGGGELLAGASWLAYIRERRSHIGPSSSSGHSPLERLGVTSYHRATDYGRCSAPSGDDADPLRLFATKSFGDEAVVNATVSSPKLLVSQRPEPSGIGRW